MPTPDISVIIGAYNAMPYLTETLTSVVGQSIGRDRLEVIAVNDGSTDGTGKELERFAELYPGLFQVFHQENSGGPSAPRNAGLDQARGRYVFFLDADDYLGEEALERMFQMAEANGTDVVLGKMVGVNGRGAPASMFARNQPRTDVFNSRVYWALNPLKLIRRELVERHKLRFPVGYKVCEDQLFTALAYLRADGISVVADYECLFIVKRDDGQNITVTTRGAEQRIRTLGMMVDLVEENVPAGPDRDTLMNRHLTIDLHHALIHLAEESDRQVQESGFHELRELLTRSYPGSLRDRVNAITRLRCELILRGHLDELVAMERLGLGIRSAGKHPDILVESGRAYARLPHFRDGVLDIPDHVYDVTRDLSVRHRLDSVSLEDSRMTLTGHAFLQDVLAVPYSTELVLRERNSGVEYRVPAEAVATAPPDNIAESGQQAAPPGGFTVTVDLASVADGGRLRKGLWDVLLALDAAGVCKEFRIGHQRLPAVSTKPKVHVVAGADGIFAAALYYTQPYGNLTVDVGENKHRVPRRLLKTEVTWMPADELHVRGDWTLAAFPASALGVRLENQDGESVEFLGSSVPTATGFAVSIPVAGLAHGTWRMAVRLAVSGRDTRAWSIEVPATTPLPPVHRDLMRYVKPEAHDGQLALQVDRLRLRGALRRRLAAVARRSAKRLSGDHNR
ncbi:glycosyltransferase family 2 protein [Streptomyces sp. ISL-100]|uniref:glycosyltransferase family 2 protein n=1 Tax=Streptomyces sp. ISL-100 TaxID=2819173 RepID=UPI001BEB6710|nr:glycosyltransferase family 2 protein [Streptomyces sp. ISL-100]MBT2396968.1 glycosyltransferase [Streptomyces sp. ISL-100]